MTWYNPISWFEKQDTELELEEKLNRAQRQIATEEGSSINTDSSITYGQAFEKLETVNRGTNMIVSAAASLDYDVKDKVVEGTISGIRQKTLNTLLNYSPNPFQSIQDFRINVFTDFILEGNVFIYYDGAHMYHLPAAKVTIETDPRTFVASYTYNGLTKYTAEEIIHFKDLSSQSIYRGTSRLVSADRNIKILYKMLEFQEQFFKNGAVTGLIITTENTLSQSAKDKTILGWAQRYSTSNGARKPMILDSGLKPVQGISQTFNEMDFDTSIKTHDTKILKSLGVPPILLDGGNNANISPNLRLFYLETVLPIANKFTSALEKFFGYDLSPITSNVSALQPELKEVSAYYVGLVNGGIITPNEARKELRFDKVEGHDDLRIPANIAGSAADPNQGGAPTKAPKG